MPFGKAAKMNKKTTRKPSAKRRATPRVVWPDLFGPLAKADIKGLLAWVGAESKQALGTNLAETLSQEKGVPVLLLCADPATAVARLLRDGTEPEAAVALWRDWAEVTIKAQRRASRRITIADIRLAQDQNTEGQNTEALAQLAERFGLEVPDAFGGEAKRDHGSKFDRLCAVQLLAADPEAAALCAQLREVVIAPQVPPFGTDVVLGAMAEVSAERDATEGEIARLRDALRQHVDSVGEFAAQKDRLTAALAQNTAQQAQIAQLSAEHQKLAAQAQENVLLRQTVALHLESIGEFSAQSAAQQAQIAQLSAESQKLAAQAQENVLLRQTVALHLENTTEMAAALRSLQAQAVRWREIEADRLVVVAQKEALERDAGLRATQRRISESVLGERLLRDAAERRGLVRRLSGLEVELTQHSGAAARLGGELEAERGLLVALRSEIASIRSTLKSAHDEIRALGKVNAAQKEDIKHSRVQKAEASKALGKAHKERDAARLELENMLKRIEGLEGELAKIYGSNSWRLTEPMRALRRATGPTGEK